MKFITRFFKKAAYMLLFIQCFCTLSVSAQNLDLSTLKPITQQVLNKQGEGVYFAPYDLFQKDKENTIKIDDKSLSKATIAKMDPRQLSQIFSQKEGALKLNIPFENTMISVLLLKTEVLADGFQTFSSENSEKPVSYTPGVYYRGIIEGDLNSLVAISFFEDDVIGMASSDQLGNISINKTEGNNFLIYSDKDLLVPRGPGCGTVEPENYGAEVQKYLEDEIETRDQKCFKIYLECDYALYVNKGSVSNVNNWITSVYNNIAALYANENIPTQIASTFVWTSQDPYNTNSSYSALNAFKSLRPVFVGDIAHLAALGGNNIGGIAWVNSLCSAFKYAYSNIYSTYSNVPVYSWTVEVMTHEIGHNLGSPHTHSCTWTGGALDNCYPVEGSCNPGPAPTNGGTIMSYCHLTSNGINFNNGFGTQPGNLIRNRVNNASCLGLCQEGGGTPCNPPETVTVTNITNNTALVSWSNALAATAYVLEYRILGAANWTVLPPQPTTSKLLQSLNSGTTYQVRIKTICTNENSNYSQVINFTTGSSCSTPQNLLAENITINSARVKWNAVSGATAYDLRYKLTANSSWNTFTVSATQVDFSGLTASTSYDVSVRARCGSVTSNYTTTVTFVTLGPTNDDPPYCPSSGLNSSAEWIDYVELNDIKNLSGNNGGYGDFLDLTASLNIGDVYIFEAYAGMVNPTTEYWDVWIDYDQDGYFNSTDEHVYNFKTYFINSFSNKLVVPTTALPGQTWMRVQMSRVETEDACEVFAYGEVEDYGIYLSNGFNGGGNNSLKNFGVFPNPFSNEINLSFNCMKSTGIEVNVFNTQGVLVHHSNSITSKGHNTVKIDGNEFLANGVYILQVKGDNINETHKIIKMAGRN